MNEYVNQQTIVNKREMSQILNNSIWNSYNPRFLHSFTCWVVIVKYVQSPDDRDVFKNDKGVQIEFSKIVNALTNIAKYYFRDRLWGQSYGGK
jgi:hypothetical protein